MKSEASNADKNVIETFIAELRKQKVIINKRTCHGLVSFYNSSKAKQSETSPLSNLLLLKAATSQVIN